MVECKFDPCSRNPDDNTKDGYCILHSESPYKDKDAFAKALAGHPRPTFSNIVFPPGAVFTDSEFSSAIFIGAIFLGKADFRMKSFTGLIDFQYARFDGAADFAKATFDGEVNFKGARFMKDARFSNAKFKEGANFRDTTFLKDANFSHAEFGEDICASEGLSHATQVFDAESPEGANFNEAKFKGKADFTCVRFCSGEADFRDAKFTDEAIFYGIEFGQKAGKANFFEAHFAEKANFVRARLMTESNFISATFEKGAIFDGTIFADLVSFDGATFLGRTIFGADPREEEPIFARAKMGSFTNVTIAPLDSVTFKDADLQRCLFQGTDLRKAEITNAKWPKRDKSVRLMGKLSWTYDEDLVLRELQKEKSQKARSQKDKISQFSHIEQLYRQLKQNSEDRRDYERARDFHFGEKEMRRKNPETSRGLKLLLWLYRLVAGYGESASRAFLSVMVVLLLCTLLYLVVGICPKSGPPLAWKNPSDWLDAALYSLRVMILMKPDELGPINDSKLVHTFIYTLESIAGPLLLGLFGLALRQRLKR